MTGRKYIILVGDGMGDYPLEELSGRTPLQAARTPNMDAVARRGRLGLVQTIPEGLEPGSDIANLNLMGYDPKRYHTGRAPLEAASMGVDLGRDKTAFRCNLVTLGFRDDGIYMEDYSAGHIASDKARLVVDALNEELADDVISFHPGVSYRHLMVWDNGPEKAPSFPPHDLTGREVGYLLNDFDLPGLNKIIRDSWNTLERLKETRGDISANSVWLWGSGKAPAMPSFKERYGVTGGVISAVDLLKGIGVYAGLEVINVPGATGYLDTNYEGKARCALDRLKELDFVYVHVEAPDEASHGGSLENKIRAIEDFDERVVGPVLAGMETFGKFRLLVVTDHNTPISVKTHTSEPVPFAMLDEADPPEGAPGRGYNEIDAALMDDFVEEAHLLVELLVRP